MNAAGARARETCRSILDAALELFGATGYAATTIQAIAERAGAPRLIPEAVIR